MKWIFRDFTAHFLDGKKNFFAHHTFTHVNLTILTSPNPLRHCRPWVYPDALEISIPMQLQLALSFSKQLDLHSGHRNLTEERKIHSTHTPGRNQSPPGVFTEGIPNLNLHWPVWPTQPTSAWNDEKKHRSLTSHQLLVVDLVLKFGGDSKYISG